MELTMDTRKKGKSSKKINRRDFLALSGVVGAATLVAACGGAADAETQAPTRASANTPSQTSATITRASTQTPTQATTAEVAATTPTPEKPGVVLRIAHISDMHMDSENAAISGFSRVLAQVQKLTPAVDVVFNTGDCVMDSLKADKKSAEAQWEQFTTILKANCSLPVFHAIGNHDVWGWGLPKSSQQKIQGDPLYGKGLALQQLGLRERYYSFDKAGWHFIVLDSTHSAADGAQYPYTGKLDEDQFAWLTQELFFTPSSAPVCILSHIPILCACEFFDGENEKTGNWIVPGAWMHIDARRMRQLFQGYPNIRLCLSGHTHQQERLEYLGVKYLNDGAICGNWWQGSYLDFPPGYVVIELYADGSSNSRFITYNT
jgi:3',5'-cyclic AMP phosphodiesterase CpdA